MHVSIYVNQLLVKKPTERAKAIHGVGAVCAVQMDTLTQLFFGKGHGLAVFERWLYFVSKEHFLNCCMHSLMCFAGQNQF